MCGLTPIRVSEWSAGLLTCLLLDQSLHIRKLTCAPVSSRHDWAQKRASVAALICEDRRLVATRLGPLTPETPLHHTRLVEVILP